MREIKVRLWNEATRTMLQPEEVCHLDGELSKGCEQNGNTPLLFTGRYDLDKQPIFDGDIMEWYNAAVRKGTDPIMRTAVTWNEDMARFEGCFSAGRIIGNIYQNPELVKQD